MLKGTIDKFKNKHIYDGEKILSHLTDVCGYEIRWTDSNKRGFNVYFKGDFVISLAFSVYSNTVKRNNLLINGRMNLHEVLELTKVEFNYSKRLERINVKYDKYDG